MFNVRTITGEDVQLDFDKMSDEELRDLENSVSVYRIRKREADIQKSVDVIIDCIETEMKKCPALKGRTVCITEDDEHLDWDDFLSILKNIG